MGRAATTAARPAAGLAVRALLCLTLLLTETASTETCAPSDPCCFSSLPHRQLLPNEPTAQGGADVYYSYASSSWMQSCLRAVPVEGPRARAAVGTLQAGLREWYSLTGTVEDSLAAKSLLSEAYSGAFSTYQMQVNASALLLDVLISSKLPGLDDHHSAYDFHYGVAAALRSLQDTGTSYTTPFGAWELLRPLGLWPVSSTGGAGAVEWTLRELPSWRKMAASGEFGPEGYQAVHGQELPSLPELTGRVVALVNGVPPKEFLLSRAAQVEALRDPQACLTALLNAEGSLQPLAMGSAPPPDTDSEEYTFEDGGSVTLQVTVRHRGDAQTAEDLAVQYGQSSTFDAVSELYRQVATAYNAAWGQAGLSSGAPTLLDRAEEWQEQVEQASLQLAALLSAPQIAQPNGDGEMYCDYSDCDYSMEDYEETDFLQEDETPIADAGGENQAVRVRAAYSGRYLAEAEPFLAVYHLPGEMGGAMVLKVSSFSPSGGFFGPLAGTAGAGQATERVMSELYAAMAAAEAYARPRGVTRLLLDLSANAGGSPTAAYFLLRVIQKGWKGPADLCPVSALRRSAAGAFLTGEDAGHSEVSASVEGDLATAAPLLHATKAVVSILSSVTGAGLSEGSWSSEVTEGMLINVLANQGLTDAQKAGLLVGFLADAEDGLRQAVLPQSLSPTGKYSLASGGSVLESWFSPEAEGEGAEAPRLTFGNFTSPFFTSACLEALDAFSRLAGGDPTQSVHQFEKVVVLTDGTCAGSCSVVATRLRLSGAVGLVSFGGSGDGPMHVAGSYGDSASYHWIDHSFGTMLGSFVSLLLGRSPVDGAAPVSLSLAGAPGPLPFSASSASMSVQAGFDPYMGPHALPTDLYMIPSDNHLRMWAEYPASGEDLRAVWRAAFAEFDAAPLLADWEPRQWVYSAGEKAPEPANEPSAAPQTPPVTATSDKVIVISALITFNDMQVEEVTEPLKLAVRSNLANFNSVDVSSVVVLSVTPGSAVWEVAVVFPLDKAAFVSTYVATLRTNTPFLFVGSEMVLSYGPEKSTVRPPLYLGGVPTTGHPLLLSHDLPDVPSLPQTSVTQIEAESKAAYMASAGSSSNITTSSVSSAPLESRTWLATASLMLSVVWALRIAWM